MTHEERDMVSGKGERWEQAQAESDDAIRRLPPVNPQEPKYCDRNICLKNEYNGIGCDECEVTKMSEIPTGSESEDKE